MKRPAIWADDVDGLDVFRLRAAKSAFALHNVRDFRAFGSRNLPDRQESMIDTVRF
jgi:hypothetical protein